MRAKVAAALAAGFLLFGKTAWAHRIDEYLQATLLSVEATRVHGSMRMIPGVLVAEDTIAGIDSDGDGVYSDDEERAYAQRVLGDLSIAIDGQTVRPKLLSWSYPEPAQMRAGIGEIHIEYEVDLPLGGPSRNLVLANHHQGRKSVYLMNVVVPEDRGIQILAQQRNEQQSVYELQYRQAGQAEQAGQVGRGWLSDLPFFNLFHLGMQHIREGTDHLLFLLVLLLPAPLLVAGSRWGPSAGWRPTLLRMFGIVTAFTVGHSITLTLAALGILQVPSRPIEVLIALSIFVSALHALRPIVPGKEAWVAGCFGLIHGLAFATTLGRLGLGHWQRVGGIAAFNLGIETMQTLVVAALLPSLLLMSRTHEYTFFRAGGAVLAAVASLGWIVERLFDVAIPVDTVVNALARHALWIAAALFLTSLACLRFGRLAKPLDRPGRVQTYRQAIPAVGGTGAR
jgi:HupE / UreJ protein